MTTTDPLAAESRVARLATVDDGGAPHVVPVCYATDGRAFYSPIDAKPKRARPEGLKRVRNIRANPRVALLIDHYEEDWARLAFVMVQGRAELLREGAEWRAARTLLEAKYPQYRAMPLAGDGLVIKIVPDRVVRWSAAS
jgi:PPOX class probable F420-dependent enzyme